MMSLMGVADLLRVISKVFSAVASPQVATTLIEMVAFASGTVTVSLPVVAS
jgi:hypothetical protein